MLLALPAVRVRAYIIWINCQKVGEKISDCKKRLKVYLKFAQVLSPSKPYQALTKKLKDNKTERKNLFNVKRVSSCYFFAFCVTFYDYRCSVVHLYPIAIESDCFSEGRAKIGMKSPTVKRLKHL